MRRGRDKPRSPMWWVEEAEGGVYPTTAAVIKGKPCRRRSRSARTAAMAARGRKWKNGGDNQAGGSGQNAGDSQNGAENTSGSAAGGGGQENAQSLGGVEAKGASQENSSDGQSSAGNTASGQTGDGQKSWKRYGKQAGGEWRHLPGGGRRYQRVHVVQDGRHCMGSVFQNITM